MFKDQKVLVAGGTGTIGIPIVKMLRARGADVTVISLDDPEYADIVLGEDVRFVRTDLTSFDDCLTATEGQDLVLNLVGIKGSTGIGTSKAASYFVPMLRFQTNLMDAAFHSGVGRYLFVSSICAYPQSAMHQEDQMWDGIPQQADRYAGIAKRVGEIQGETYLHEHGWDAVRIVRPSNVYGPFDDFNPATAQVIPALIARALSGEDPLTVWGDGSVVRDFIFSEDVAYGMLAALESAPPCVPINLGSGKGVTIKELAESVVRNVPGEPVIQWDTTKPTGDPIRLLSTERAKEILGFTPLTSLNKGIQKTIDWLQNNGRLAGLRGSALNARR